MAFSRVYWQSELRKLKEFSEYEILDLMERMYSELEEEFSIRLLEITNQPLHKKEKDHE